MLNKSLWLDQGASLYSAHLSWSALWSQSKVVDRVFLPYYVLLHLWIEVSASIEWIRLLSVIAFGLTVVVIGHLGNRLGGFWCGVVAAVLAAANPLMINAALDARPYAISALAATVAI
jgi:mannosyltransferase